MTDRRRAPWRGAVAEAMADPGVRSLALLSLLVLVGFAGLVLAWRGTAGRLSVALQLPFALSAGLGGGALLGSAAVLISVQLGRRERAVDRVMMDRVIRTTAALADTLGQRPVRRRPAFLAVGRTMHRIDCRFAKDRDDARPIGAAAATEEQLRACRVCRPVTARTPGRSPAAGEEAQL